METTEEETKEDGGLSGHRHHPSLLQPAGLT